MANVLRPVTGEIPPSITATAHWVAPHLAGHVAYRERTATGLRHPSWRGLRFDRSPAEVSVPEHNWPSAAAVGHRFPNAGTSIASEPPAAAPPAAADWGPGPAGNRGCPELIGSRVGRPAS
ncbi:hypothetical protein ACFWWS_38405 [Streptomyces sp. NPDC059083]|uniref:ATP dependent DNA ligase n=1 Tax=Streptomyces sp. NPDC059083 TaxID=3346721 RepID=UPI0036B92337